MSIDDRLYILQKSSLPNELVLLLRKADTAYLRGNETEASELLAIIELKCKDMKCPTYADEFMTDDAC